TPTSVVYTLSLHDALPILTTCRCPRRSSTTISLPRPFILRKECPISAFIVSSGGRAAKFPRVYGPCRAKARVPSATARLAALPRSEEHTSELQSREKHVCR